MAKKNVVVKDAVSAIVNEPFQAPPDTETGSSTVTETEETESGEQEIPEREFTASDLAALSDSQQAGVQAKSILATWDTVTVSAKKSPTGKAGFRYYVRLEALTSAGLSQMFNGAINAATPESKIPENATKDQREKLLTKGACDYANYGYDLERRAAARALLLSELEGPEKVVKKAVASFQALDMETEQIRSLILSSPKYKGVDGLAKIVDAALKG